MAIDVMNTPLVSIVIPAHNASKTIGETLDTIYSQTFQNFEIILIDDASTDELKQTINQHHDARLQVIHLTENLGVSAARNRGIDAALAPYIAFCDADDLCAPYRIERQINFLQAHPDIDLCGSAFICFDTKDRNIVKHPTAHANICKHLMMGNCFGLSTMMVKKKILEVIRFDTHLAVAEDYALWTALIGHGARAANLDDILVRYRLHSGQISQNKSRDLDQITRLIRARYCAQLIGFTIEPNYAFKFEDLPRAAILIEQFINTHPDYSANDFRFLMAWLYQQQSKHGLVTWRRWTRLQAELNLKLDFNYRFNTALLAMLPSPLKLKHFDLLIKLKR